MTRVRGADVGHPSGKGRNTFRGIVEKTTAVGSLMGPDTNFKHMSQEVRNNGKGQKKKTKRSKTALEKDFVNRNELVDMFSYNIEGRNDKDGEGGCSSLKAGRTGAAWLYSIIHQCT